MVEAAYSTLREVDTVLFMVPADEPRGKGDDMIIERLKAAKGQLFWWSIRLIKSIRISF